MPTFDESLNEVRALVDDFSKHRATYIRPGYTEAQARQDFIDKLLSAMGWDVRHVNQRDPWRQEVKVEKSVASGVGNRSAKRRADYAMYVEPDFHNPRFFVEAKRPHGNIATSDNIFQLVRYGWNNSTPLGVLTSFEEFHIIDCRYRPQIDKAQQCIVRSYNFQQLAQEQEFAEIFHLFGRDAVARGALAEHAGNLPTRSTRGVQKGLFRGGDLPVDEAFLQQLDDHRESLAHSLKQTNPTLDGETLTEITQRILDRLVFLRFLEDRSIETQESVSTFGDRDGVWSDFIAASQRLNSVYNGIIFKSHSLIDSRLLVDEQVFAGICQALSSVGSPYDFNSIPIHILGSIYERFLGKVIVTEGNQASVQDKPEVRKAGGVYYTPDAIVRYIVEQTVGRVIAGRRPTDIARMRFADIACGSGSFLLGLFEALLDHQSRWYNDNRSSAQIGRDTLELENGTLRLTLKKKREILLNNVFGVDIDPQAVEVAQLSLYLKLLDEETTASARNHQLELAETLLPSLSANIVCGNSLIDPRIASGELFEEDDQELLRINPMDFAAAFPQIASDGGFDAVVGNPPYVNAWDFFERQPKVREYINTQGLYQTAERHWDLYVLFIERALQLLKPGGWLGYIIPYSWALQKYALASRELLLETHTMFSVADVRGVKIFGKVPVITIIPVVRKATPSKKHEVQVLLPSREKEQGPIKAFVNSHHVRLSALTKGHEKMLRLDMTPQALAMIEKVRDKSTSIGDICYVNYGAQMSSRVKGLFGKDHVIRSGPHSPTTRPMISGRELFRHRIEWQGRFVEWAFADEMYGPRWPEFFEQPKVMIRDLTGTHRLEVAFDDSGLYCDHTVLCAQRWCDVAAQKPQPQSRITRSSQYSTRFIAGVLASKVISAFCYLVLSGEGVRTGGGFHTYPQTIRQFPLPDLDFGDEGHVEFKNVIDRDVQLIAQMSRRLKEQASEHRYSKIRHQIAAAERRIDDCLANFYGLDARDIQAIEEALKPTSPLAVSDGASLP